MVLGMLHIEACSKHFYRRGEHLFQGIRSTVLQKRVLAVSRSYDASGSRVPILPDSLKQCSSALEAWSRS